MDIHHKTLYGTCAALASGLGSLFYVQFHPVKTWPDLTAAQATEIVTKAQGVLGKDEPLTVYCLDKDCTKISHILEKAAKGAGVKYRFTRPTEVPDGASVGASTEANADRLADIVRTATKGAIAPDADVRTQITPYIAFGRFIGADE